MATIYPETYPNDLDPNDPEFRVFELLCELPEHFSVIYSKKLKGVENAKEETEIDFIIFDGEKNLINLEVKGGVIEYNGATSKWFQNGKELSPSPDRQASAATHALIKFLGKDVENINVNWALGFPNCVRPGSASPIAEVPDALIVDEQDFTEIGAAIQRICDYNEKHFGKAGVKRHFAGAILERLLRSAGFVTKVGVRIARDRDQILKVTEQQLEVLEDLEVNPRMAVMGYAGTGKTVLAQEFAKRLADRGQKVLLLFYNRMIANAVRYGLGRETPITCATFHSFAKDQIGKFDATWWESNPGKKDASFWDEVVPLKLLDLPQEKLETFDSIIVDEGQDFKEDWFENINRFLNEGPDSHFAVFFDENQDIFGRWNDLPWCGDGVARKVLRRNCRNTKEIIKYLNQVLPSEMVPFERSPLGQPVAIHEVSGAREEKAKIAEDVKVLLKEGVPPGEIVILTNTPYRESELVTLDQIGTNPVEWMGRSYRRDSRAIQISNISSFKGLEASAVLLVGCTAADVQANPEILYTQASRAKSLLKIYLTQCK